MRPALSVSLLLGSRITTQDMSGTVEVGELVPVIFNKASPSQHRLMKHLIEYENARVSATGKKDSETHTDKVVTIRPA